MDIFLKDWNFFRSKKILENNLHNISLKKNNPEYQNTISKIWENYGRIFSDYVFLNKFRNGYFGDYIQINGSEVLEKVKKEKDPVIFISGHFNNFELMAMIIEKSGINLSAIYRPLNNIFLNKIMENLRRKYLCKNQIPKGKSGSRNLLKSFKNGSSIAIMIDQRVSEGEKILFFNKEALTTTIPAQLVKRFGCKVIPVHIERNNKYYFTVSFEEPLNFDNNDDSNQITVKLNKWLENMILKNPTQWIWTHNRWKL